MFLCDVEMFNISCNAVSALSSIFLASILWLVLVGGVVITGAIVTGAADFLVFLGCINLTGLGIVLVAVQ